MSYLILRASSNENDLNELKSAYKNLFGSDLYDHIGALTSINTDLSQERKKNWWKKWWKKPSSTLVDVLIYVKGLQALVDLSQWCQSSSCQVTDKLEKLRSDLKSRENQKFDNDKIKSNKAKKPKPLFTKVKQAFNKLVSVEG